MKKYHETRIFKVLFKTSKQPTLTISEIQKLACYDLSYHSMCIECIMNMLINRYYMQSYLFFKRQNV